MKRTWLSIRGRGHHPSPSRGRVPWDGSQSFKGVQYGMRWEGNDGESEVPAMPTLTPSSTGAHADGLRMGYYVGTRSGYLSVTSSLYPSPLMVLRRRGRFGSGSIFVRRRLMWTSRVLVSP